MQKCTVGCFGSPNRLVLLSIATISLVLSLFCLDRALAADSPAARDSLPNFDKRLERAKANQPVVVNAARENATSAIRNRVKDVHIDNDEILGSPKFVASTRGFLTGANGSGGAVSVPIAAAIPANDLHRGVKTFLTEHKALFGFGPEALAAAKVSKDYVSAPSNFRTTVWQQHLDDIPVFEGIFKAHLTKNGELINIGSQFVPDLQAAVGKIANRASMQINPSISAHRAIVFAAEDIGEVFTTNQTAPQDAPQGNEKFQHFRGFPILNNISARLTWLPLDSSTLRLCWDIHLESRARGELYRVIVDAVTGEVWLRRCLTDYLSDIQMRVWTGESPAPLSPSLSSVSTYQPPVVPRTLVTLSALDPNASPAGWINDGENSTAGNNVDAHLDWNNDNTADPSSRPTGSPARVFDFPIDLTTQQPLQYSNAAVVSLFYWNNWAHDKFYQYGFTEAAGNFQNARFGRGGYPGTAVQADGQDSNTSTNFNNANFSTPADGSPPRMQMYIFTGSSPDRDSDLDAGIIIHEYTHGVSQRLVGGGVGYAALQTRGMGEGWSDFCALSLLSNAANDPDANYTVGSYLDNQDGGLTSNYYFGFRRYPYSVNLSVNPLTFKDIDTNQISAHAGVPYNPTLSSNPTFANEVHYVGEVWCNTLWEARSQLCHKYGNAAGNQLMLQLVMDGMKLVNANPTLIHARNAILQADLISSGGANLNELWTAFAKRGMGHGAGGPGSSTTTGVIESLILPPVSPYPVVSIESPAEESHHISAPTVSGTANISTGQVWVKLGRSSDGLFYNPTNGTWGAAQAIMVANALAAWNLSLPSLAEDAYLLTVNAQDGTYLSGTMYRSFKIDTTTPTLSISSPAEGDSFASPPTITGGVQDNYWVQEIRVVLERGADGAWYNFASNAWGNSVFDFARNVKFATVVRTNWLATLPSLDSGFYGIQVQAVDRAGNDTAWSVRHFAMDAIVPTVTITTPVANGVYTTMPTATGTANDNSRVREVRVALVRSSDLFWWNFASNTWGNAVFAFEYTVKIATGTTNWSASLPSLPVGGYQLHVQSVDIADLGSPWIFRNFTIETGTTVTVVTDPTNWRESTTVDSTSADEVPWPGVTSLPEASTFTDIPTGGTTHVIAVPGATNFASGSSVRFFRSTFNLPHFNTLELDIHASFDNDLQIFINGHELALEGNYSLANFSGPNHRIIVNQDGSINNDYEGEQVFSTRVATNFPSSFFQTGSNEIVLALRNNNGGDSGGVAFRADFLMTGVEDTGSPTVAITTPTTNGGYSTMPMATGTASASGGVRDVLVALSRNSDGFWWNFTNSAWGNSVWDYRTVIATGTTNWSANLPSLPAGGYQVHAQTVDMADQGSAWLTRHFTIAASGGTVVAWGVNTDGQTNVPAGLGAVTAIAAGGLHLAALKSDGTVVAWGYNTDGQTNVPAGLGAVTAIAAGYFHTVALKSDGTVVAWGRNLDGQTNVPAGLGGVTAIAAGSRHTLALKSDGTVVAWGYSAFDQSTVPAGLSGVTSISGGGFHSVALMNDGTVVGWGRNYEGQTTVPVGLSGVAAIAAGYNHTVALKSNGTVVAWGENDFRGQTDVPVGLSGVTAIAAGYYHTVALKNDGTVVAWGWNQYDQTEVPIGLSGVMSIAAGYYNSMALRGELVPICSPPVTGLVSWWAGEGDAGDVQGVNPGVVVGPAAFPQGKVGSAFHFGGQNFVQIADAPTLRPAHVTIEAWVKFDSLESPNAVSPGLQYILFKKNSRALNFEGYSLLKHRVGGVDKFAFQVTSASGAIAHVDSPSPVGTNQWHHLAGSYDGFTSKLYVDGMEQGSQAGNFPLDYGDRPLVIGSSGEGNHDGRFVGEIDEVSLYSRALSAAEILSIFQAGALGKCKPLLVEQTYSTNATVIFPPLPPGADAILTAAPSSPQAPPVEVTVVLTNDVYARNVEINAALGSLLRLLVPDFISLNAVSVIVGAGGELSVNGQVVANVTVRDDGVIFLGRGIVGDVYNLQGTVARSRPILQRAIINQIVGSSIGRLTPDRILEAGLSILRMIRVQSVGPPAAEGGGMPPPPPPPSLIPMSITGDYDQAANGTLFIAIGGTNIVTDGAQEYDRLEITGTASLSGVIGYDLVDPSSPTNNANPFQPQAGAQFDIVVAGNIVVGNLAIRGPVWGNGLGMAWGVVPLLDGREALRLVATHIPPPLVIQRQVSAVKIFYPTNFTGYTLQHSSTITSSNWTAISTTTNHIEIASTNASDFFRLFKQ